MVLINNQPQSITFNKLSIFCLLGDISFDFNFFKSDQYHTCSYFQKYQKLQVPNWIKGRLFELIKFLMSGTSWERVLGFSNGLVAGVSQVFVMQPFEIIKVRLQTQSKEAPAYKGIIDCLTKIVKNEGPLALYKGTVTPLFGVSLLGSVRFGLYQNFKKEIALWKGNGTAAPLELADKMAAAFVAGNFVSLLLCPIEHTRIRIQIQRGQADNVYTGSVDATSKIFKQYGIRGLFRGQGPTTVRESTGLCIYFTVIEYITGKLTPPNTDKNNVPIYVPLISGGLGGTSYWVFNYPFDYVKTLMQSDKLGDFKYKSMAQCFSEQFKQNGWRTFYRGYLICLMRSFPVNAIAITVYRFMQKVTGVN